MREKERRRGLEGMKNRNAREREGEMVRQRRSGAPTKDIFMVFRLLSPNHYCTLGFRIYRMGHQMYTIAQRIQRSVSSIQLISRIRPTRIMEPK